LSFALLNKRSAPLLAAAICALLFAGVGCGEDAPEPRPEAAPAVIDENGLTTAGEGSAGPADEPADPETDRATVAATLQRVLTSADPDEACDELVTPRYVRRSFGDRAGCRAAQSRRAAARTVRVSEVVVTPESTAQAVVRARGGVYAGERLRAELVLDQGLWRLDELRSNVPVGP
jgi:hypothetical protein